VLLKSVTEATGTEYTASGLVLPDGSYTLIAVATGDLGVTRRSKPVKVVVQVEKKFRRTDAYNQLMTNDDALGNR
jgi:hypothetical protein